MVSFMRQLGRGLRDAQRAGETLFLAASVRVSLEAISIWIGGMRKEDYIHRCG